MQNFPKMSALAIAIASGASLGTAAAAETNLMLEEVVVTAQKRQENLQDVPASINAFSGDFVEQAGWIDISKMQESIPSLVTGGESKSRPYIAIRGIGTRKFDIGADGSVGLFVDEIYNARFSSTLSSLMDVERIEVLKGPQGTLYGRNTIGGAINVFTRKPTNEFEAKVKASAGNYDSKQFGASVSGAIVEDVLLGRISGSYSDTGGLIEDTVSGEDNNHETTTLRGSLIYNIGENWELTGSADYSDVESDAVLTDVEPGEVFGVVLVSPADPRVPAVVAEGAEDRYSNEFSEVGFVDREASQYSFKAKHSGDVIDFLSITSYSDEDYSELRDFDGTRLESWFATIDQKSSQLSQEFRFSSVDGGFATFDDRLTWVVGAFYFEDDAERLDGQFNTSDSILVPPSLGLELGYTNFYTELETTSYALYSQATYALTDALNLTLGLRYSNDTKDFQYSALTNTPLPPVTQSFTVADEIEFSSTDPKLSLDYHFSDEVMAYATYSEGYKSGGVQFAVGTPEGALDSFDEERLTSVEVGLKSRLFDDRVQFNMAAYQYDYIDQQLQSIVNDGSGAPTAKTNNVGESDMKGIELEVIALLTESLTLDFKYAWLDATFEEFETDQGSFTGNDMPAAPENAATVSLNYNADIGDLGQLTFNAGYSWKDDQYFNFENSDLALQESYGVTNLAAWWDSPDASTRVRIFCDNCSDDEHMLNFTTFPDPFGGGRRTWDYGRKYGAEITYNF